MKHKNIGFKARIPMKIKIKKGLTNSKKTEQLVRMEATQFPVVSNNATTG